jgi:hypothetical protein
MVRRRASRIEVWDEAKVAALEAGKSESITELLVDAGTDMTRRVDDERTVHRGKYRQLSVWLSNQDVDQVRASFGEIEEAMGRRLPGSCRDHVRHWHSYQGSAVARAIADAGWRARDVNLTAETVRFERVRHVDAE